GDPNVYATFGYLAETERAALPEVVVETVPGITAMQALAAASGRPLVEGREPLTPLPLARRADLAPLRADPDGGGTIGVDEGGQPGAPGRAAVRPRRRRDRGLRRADA